MERTASTESKQLREWVNSARRIVFFGGAGVSTESGIPDFRSVDGLYNQTYDYPPETILSHSFFCSKPAAFFRFTAIRWYSIPSRSARTPHIWLWRDWRPRGRWRGRVS